MARKPSKPGRPVASHFPTDAKERKGIPMARGLLDYFPGALADVAWLSRIGNDQHNPGEPIHWAKEKSVDHADCILRHVTDRGLLDNDNVPHSVKLCWRALALRQIEIDAANGDAEAIKQIRELGTPAQNVALDAALEKTRKRRKRKK